MKKNSGIGKDLKQLARMEKATTQVSLSYLPVGIAFLFLLAVFYALHLFTGQINNGSIIILAGVLGAYMAMNIGANDSANNVGPAVGSGALTLAGALAIAATFEATGALLAGGDVVSTIKKGIIDQSQITENSTFILLMLAALLSAALWLNLATYLGAPVSTTHSIVGGVMGAGVAAVGMAVVNWPTMGKIAASWVISPVLGGLIAASLFKLIKTVILSKDDMLAASKRWVPILVGVMASAFTMYLMVKGLKKIWKPSTEVVWMTGLAVFFILPLIIRPFIASKISKVENKAKGVNKLFTIPLIISAALLSFAHGSNDVANSIGPLAAIVSAAEHGTVSAKVEIPIWVMAIGAVGMAFGLSLFGPRVIKTVGKKITKIDKVRAYCIALSSAVTVIVASTLGLPVSTTHITVGGVFGVGLYREFSNHKKRKKAQTLNAQKLEKRKLVRRRYLLSIAAAWVITVPCAALLAATVYTLLDYFGLAQYIS